MAENVNPWLELKPPASDDITYLTFIETNLTAETLPMLQEVLKDQALTQSIGWDLVHLLLPLIPASEPCLLDIAKYGNPREVVLKVSECLRILELDALDARSEQEDLEEATVASKANASRTAAQSLSSEEELPLSVLQFRVLLSMLSILHPRIKTKFPSRFLASTLQAVVATYGQAASHQDELTEDVVKFIKQLTGNKRPVLPSRRSSSKVLLQDLAKAAPDPEATTEEDTTKEEIALQRKLLQSCLTHVLEDYMLSLSSQDDVPGLTWAARLQEKEDPSHVVPYKHASTVDSRGQESFKSRQATVGSIVALAQDLDVEDQSLLDTMMDVKPELRGDEKTEDEPPSHPSDIPLSKTGSLFLITARKAAEVFYNRPKTLPPMRIFPEHYQIVKNFLDPSAKAAIGLQPDSLVDAILFLGLSALAENAVGEPASDEDFNEYLQNISLLSANSSSPTLRYHAHYLCTTVLRSHPHDLVRLSFIRDTLEHCPFENLKTSAVSWIKGETIEANPPGAAAPGQDDTPSIFATPVALSTLSPYLFPDLEHLAITQDLSGTYTQFLADLSFYLASLNFYYLLLRAKHLHEPLDIRGLSQQSDIGASYLEPLSQAAGRLKEALKEGGELCEGEVDTHAIMELTILEDVVARVREGIVEFNKTP